MFLKLGHHVMAWRAAHVTWFKRWWLDLALLIDGVSSYLLPLLVNVLELTERAHRHFRGEHSPLSNLHLVRSY